MTRKPIINGIYFNSDIFVNYEGPTTEEILFDKNMIVGMGSITSVERSDKKGLELSIMNKSGNNVPFRLTDSDAEELIKEYDMKCAEELRNYNVVLHTYPGNQCNQLIAIELIPRIAPVKLE